MLKDDVKSQFKALYQPPSNQAVLVNVPVMEFLMIDGSGDPNTSQEYREAIEALYGLAYTLKFAIKKQQGIEYKVMPLEGLWWADDMRLFSTNKKEDWKWTMLLMQPEHVTTDLLEQARQQVTKKKPSPALMKVRLESFHEGWSAQIMYLGPYSAEGPTIARLHAFIKEHGYTLRGKHHEIYLGDPRRSAPEKLKTVIRQPIGDV